MMTVSLGDMTFSMSLMARNLTEDLVNIEGFRRLARVDVCLSPWPASVTCARDEKKG